MLEMTGYHGVEADLFFFFFFFSLYTWTYHGAARDIHDTPLCLFLLGLSLSTTFMFMTTNPDSITIMARRSIAEIGMDDRSYNSLF